MLTARNAKMMIIQNTHITEVYLVDNSQITTLEYQNVILKPVM